MRTALTEKSSEQGNNVDQSSDDFRNVYYINIDVKSKYSYLTTTQPALPTDVASSDDLSAVLATASAESSSSSPSIPPKPNFSAADIEAMVFDIDPKLGPRERKVMQDMLVSTFHAFATNPKVPPIPSPGVSHAIHLTDPQPIKQRPYRQSPAKMLTVETTVAELQSRDLIQPSNSAWSSPIVLVPKQNGDWRMCIDYRKVNNHTKKDAYPTPNIRDCLNLCKGANLLTLIDIKDAYHHILMEENSVAITAFATPRGLYEWKRMPFGLCNAPATFQRYVDNCLRGLLGLTCSAFFDDVAVYTTGEIEDHARDVKAVLERLTLAGLEANIKKCHFAYSEMLFIGHIVSKGTIRPDPAKLRAVKEIPVPQNLAELRSFLGLANYYHDFIAGFALTCRPLYKLTRKNEVFEWNGDCDAAFNSIKSSLIAAPCLFAPNFKLPFILQTDASGIGIAAVLTQDVDGAEHPIGFISRQLSKHEQNYSAIEWECLAVVWGIGQFQVYLCDAPFTVVTDHAPLQWLPVKNIGNSRMQRWAMFISEFTFKVVHRAGTKNGNVDALSRLPLPNSAPTDMSIDPAVAPDEVVPHYVRTYLLSLLPEELFPVLQPSFNVMKLTANQQKFDTWRRAEPMPPSSSSSSSTTTVPSSSLGAASSTSSHSSTTAPSKLRTDDETDRMKSMQAVSLVDLSKVDKVIDAQYNDHRTNDIISYKQTRQVPSNYSEPMKKRLIAMSYNHVLLPQGENRRPALFYFPSSPRRGLSSLVPIVPRLVIPFVFRNYIIEMYHAYAFGGHFGVRRTARKVQTNYYWDTLLQDVTTYVAACEACNKEKIQRSKLKRPPGLMEQPTQPFELLSMDHVGPIEPASGDFKYILVIVDHFSKFAITVPTLDTGAETTARALIDEVYNRYGTPLRLLSDRGSAFISYLCRELHQYLRVKQLFASAHHPQSNGMVERFNATLKDMLHALGSEFKSSWVDALQSATFAYNTSVHEATGMTPYYVLYGREAIVPGDALALAVSSADVDSKLPMAAYNQYQLDNIGRAQEFIRSLLDSKTSANLEERMKYARIPSYHVGDLVLVRNPLSDTTTGAGRSHVTPFSGPHVVLRRAGEYAYEFKINGQLTLVNVDRIKPYRPIESHSLSSDALAGRTEPFVVPSIPRLGNEKYRPGIGAVDSDEDEDPDSVHLRAGIAEESRTAVASAPFDNEPDLHDAMDTTMSSSDSATSGQPRVPTIPTSLPRRSDNTLAAGPSAAAKSRHAGKPTPLYSDDFALRLPGNPVQKRYSMPSTSSSSAPVTTRAANQKFKAEVKRIRAELRASDSLLHAPRDDIFYASPPSYPFPSSADRRRK